MQVVATQDQPLGAKTKVHLDLKKIRFRPNSGEKEERTIDDAALELMEQLGGNKFSSGKLWKYALTDPDSLFAQVITCHLITCRVCRLHATLE